MDHRFTCPSVTVVTIYISILPSHAQLHTTSIAFRHLPPNSARFSYAIEGALFISAQLSSDAVSALRKVRVLIKLQALVYDILPWRKVPESVARCVR